MGEDLKSLLANTPFVLLPSPPPKSVQNKLIIVWKAGVWGVGNLNSVIQCIIMCHNDKQTNLSTFFFADDTHSNIKTPFVNCGEAPMLPQGDHTLMS